MNEFNPPNLLPPPEIMIQTPIPTHTLLTPQNMNAQIFQKYLMQRYNPNTVRQYYNAYKHYHRFFSTQTLLNDWTLSLVQRNKHQRLNSFYVGFIRAYIDCFQLPLYIPKSKRKSHVTPTPKFLTKEEMDSIINHTTARTSMLVRLFFDTGLRLRELINTERKNISLTNRTIKGMGKNNRLFEVKYSTTTKDVLKQYLEIIDYPYPFHYAKEYKDHAKKFWQVLKKECKKPPINIDNMHPHRIRHSLGHHLRADQNFDLQQIKLKLRHVKIQTTEIYTEATQKEVDDLIDEKVFKEIPQHTPFLD